MHHAFAVGKHPTRPVAIPTATLHHGLHALRNGKPFVPLQPATHAHVLRI